MDPLTQQLLQRQLAAPQAQVTPATPPLTTPQAAPPPSSPLPATPPNPHPHLGSEAQRFQDAQAVQNAYRGGWAPNPVLLQATLTK